MADNQRVRPNGTDSELSAAQGSSSTPGYAHELSGLLSYIEHFQRRVIQDALTEATAAYWRHRADQFDAALPQPGDYPGQATPAELEARRTRVAATAQACRHRAQISMLEATP